MFSFKRPIKTALIYFFIFLNTRMTTEEAVSYRSAGHHLPRLSWSANKGKSSSSTSCRILSKCPQRIMSLLTAPCSTGSLLHNGANHFAQTHRHGIYSLFWKAMRFMFKPFLPIFLFHRSVSSGLSAVCAFRLADIKASFSGDYKTFDLERNHWSHHPNTDGKLGTVTPTKKAG